MTTVREEAAVEWLNSGGLLDCAKCGHRYEPEEWESAEAFGFLEPSCEDCGCQGFIPRRPAEKVADRFPTGIGDWTPVPNALMDHGDELGLKAAHRLVIIALDRHRRRRGDVVWPSLERLVHLTGLSRATVGRRLDDLVDHGLLVRHGGRGKRGRWGANAYDLEPLWERLAALTAPHVETRSTLTASQVDTRSTPTATQVDTRTVSQVDTRTGSQPETRRRGSEEVEALERRAVPAQAAPASADGEDLDDLAYLDGLAQPEDAPLHPDWEAVEAAFAPEDTNSITEEVFEVEEGPEAEVVADKRVISELAPGTERPLSRKEKATFDRLNSKFPPVITGEEAVA